MVDKVGCGTLYRWSLQNKVGCGSVYTVQMVSVEQGGLW